MATYTYVSNKIKTDGTTELKVTSGVIPLGGNGDFTSQEHDSLAIDYNLVPGVVQVDIENGTYESASGQLIDPNMSR